MSIYQRNIPLHIKNRLATRIEDAQQVGIDMIELMSNSMDVYETTIVGVDELMVEYAKTAPGQPTQLIKRWVDDGELVFYPDNRGRRWGYLCDTKDNRRFLADTLCQREQPTWFTIVDPKIRDEIYLIAKENNISTTPLKDVALDKYLNSKDPKQEQLSKLEDELKRTKEEAEHLKFELETQKNAKPLKGVRIKLKTVEDSKEERLESVKEPEKV